jgi:hypothetical protein
MTRTVAVLLIAAAVANGQLLRDTKTQSLEFAPGGTIRIEGSHGDLNIEGWDHAEVEVSVTKIAHDPNKRLDDINVAAARTSPSEVVITTTFPKRTLHRLNRAKSGVALEYRIRVPRDSHLIVTQDLGMVMVIDVTGKVEARNNVGDILVLTRPPASKDDLHVGIGSVTAEETPSLPSRIP